MKSSGVVFSSEGLQLSAHCAMFGKRWCLGRALVTGADPWLAMLMGSDVYKGVDGPCPV